MKNQQGITLIALVITIIVLLILAGVTIAMLTGDNGLLTRANEAKTENEYAGIKDKVNLAIQAVYADVKTPGSGVTAITESAIATQYVADNGANTATGTDGSGELTITEGGVTYTVSLSASGNSMIITNITK